MENELYHHGILGMKWGDRNGPPYPLKAKSHSASEKKAGWRKSLSEEQNDPEIKRHVANIKMTARKAARDTANFSKKQIGLNSHGVKRKDMERSRKELRRSIEDLDDYRVEKKLLNETNKSKTRLRYEEQYRKQGLSAEDAAMQAYKRERMNKILAVTAGVAVVSLAAYGAYKYRNYAVDKVIGGDTLLSRISEADYKGIGDSVYASLKKHKMDTNKYLGLYAKELKKKGFLTDNEAEKIFKLGQTTKVASQKNARKALEEIIRNDPKMAKELEGQIGGLALAHPVLGIQAQTALSKGKITKKVYDAFSVSLGVDRDSDIAQKFFSVLKQKGYGAIEDMNDIAYSGYKSKLPVIIFDTSKASVEKMRSLGATEQTLRYYASVLDIGSKFAAKGAAAYGGVKLFQAAKNQPSKAEQERKIVSRYRKEHPNSELSFREIVRMNEDSMERRRK